MTNLNLEFTTTNGIKTLQYQLADNPIAAKWLKKIRHLQRIPVDRSTTSTDMIQQPYWYYKKKLDIVLDWINTHTDLCLDKKIKYDQQDLVTFHDHYLDLMQNSRYDSCTEIHEFNTLIHCCEHALLNTPMNFFKISWGSKEGLLMEKFVESPYKYYTEDIVPGNLYIFWAEQGKTPGEYYFSKDPDNLENFLKVTVPHQQFSGFFTLQIGPKYTCSHDFWQWFEKYKQAFLNQWQLDDWTTLHQDGAIKVATMLSSTEQFHELKHTFIRFERIHIPNE